MAAILNFGLTRKIRIRVRDHVVKNIQSFNKIGPLEFELKIKIDIQNGRRDGHLGFCIGVKNNTRDHVVTIHIKI